MEYRTLGGTDLLVSLAGLGCNNFGMRIDAAASRAVVDAAIDAGVTFFDTARSYGGGQSEEFLGAALGRRRPEIIVATKFGAAMEKDDEVKPGGSPAYIRRAVERSLKALGSDYIDVYQLHFPDPNTPIDDTIAALNELIEQGKVRHIGHSNLDAVMTTDAHDAAVGTGMEPFVSAQLEWSLLNRAIEGETLGACRRAHLGILPYFPLASGLLTGKYRRGETHPEGSRLAAMSYFEAFATAENFAKVDALTAWAETHGRTITEVALSWLATRPETASVIAGATRPEQVVANAAATRADLTATEMAELDALSG